jgi:DNA-directed RNA polymerase subunit RPC12/RpoP
MTPDLTPIGVPDFDGEEVYQQMYKLKQGLCIECSAVVENIDPKHREGFCPYCRKHSVYGVLELDYDT